ncbi:MAG: hypothetical protein HZC49_06075 [Nitrospirae bacterium]|nr:hypothetical protein [Nitrospirota bacterium]
MILNKVVARFKDGTLMKGTTADFFPTKKEFHLTLMSGEIVQIDVERLKALFFVKDLEGNKDHKEEYSDVVPGGGRKVRIEFNDGETVIGFSQGYSPNRQGFFVIPADRKSNNERFFVVVTATNKVTFI